ncbi:DnaJ domain-containing protein [Lenzites betulinus]|nr:DnaJ domain-containing protein [Lenzites betulinus]
MQALRIPSLRLPAHPFSYSCHPRTPVTTRNIRHFVASCPRHGHYQTLDLPKDAPRNQIKAHFYKLSKKYHPDVNSDPGAKEKFQAVSEAYAILGDERKRRAYDRTLAPSAPAGHAHAPHESHHAYTHWSYETRRRGATHAWEYARRPHPNGPRHSYAYPPPPGSSSSSSTSTSSSSSSSSWTPPNSHYTHNAPHARTNPFAHPNVQRATGRRGPLPTGAGGGGGAPPPATSDAVSMLGRTVTVAVLVFLIATIGHGMSASAA